MRDENKVNYTVTWKQPYTEWIAMEEAILEFRVEDSDLSEAKAEIARIMAL